MKEDELTSLRSRVAPEPLVSGGTNLIVQRLDTADPEYWEFRMTVSYRWITGVILLFGVSVMGSVFFQKDFPMCIFMILFGGMFLLVGLVTLSYGRRRACFDFGSGCCWRGKGRFHGGDMEKRPDYLPLREIAALQIIRKICRGYKGCSYCSYELNLVKNDGSRINILNHGGRKAVEEDARLLAERLKVPVWEPEPDKEAGQRQGSHKKKWGAVIIGALFILLGIIVFYILILSPLLLYLEARNWEKVPATVISSELIRSQSGNKTLYRIAISYRYQYNGKTCQSSRYDITRSEHSSNVGVDAMRRIVRNHPPGIPLFCWVNPDNPEQALVDRTLPNTFYLIWLWFPLPFLGLGLWAVIAGLRGR